MVGPGRVGLSLGLVGPGLLAGAGYDIRIRPNISITRKAMFGWGGGGDVEFEGRTAARNWKQDYISLVLGITFH